MDSENKQRIILYFDKETIEKMDYFIKQYSYRFRNDFVPSVEAVCGTKGKVRLGDLFKREDTQSL